MKLMKIHPIAECYPPLDDKSFQALVAHIKANGLQNPIVLYENQILDGVHRYRVCTQLKIKPEFVTPEIADPFEYVIGQNERRRQLDKTQLGIVGERMAILKRGRPVNTSADVFIQESMDKAVKKVAKRLGIGATTIDRVRYTKTHALPEIIEALETGKITPSRASHIAHLAKEEQLAALVKYKSFKRKTESRPKIKKRPRANWRDYEGPPPPLPRRCEVVWHSLLSLHFSTFRTKEERKVAAQYIIAACTKMIELIDEVDTLEELFNRTH